MKNDLGYYQYKVGRKESGWVKPNELVWNTLLIDYNNRLVIYNVLPGINFWLVKSMKTYKKLKSEYTKKLKEEKNIEKGTDEFNKLIEKFDSNYKENYFSEDLRSAIQYQYWSRFEYESCLCSYTPMIPREQFDEIVNNINETKELVERMKDKLSTMKESDYKSHEEFEKAKHELELNYSIESSRNKLKVDVVPDGANVVSLYDQCMINWPQLLDYVWDNRKLIKEIK